MKMYGLKRNYNVVEDARTKYDGWKSSENHCANKKKTAWKKCLHRSTRRVAKHLLKLEVL